MPCSSTQLWLQQWQLAPSESFLPLTSVLWGLHQIQRHPSILCCPSTPQISLASLCCLVGCIGGKYSNSFPSMLSSFSSRYSSVKFLKMWIISFLSSVTNLASISSSSLVYEVNEPSFELCNDPNSGISLPCLSYRGLDFKLASVMQPQSKGHP